MSHDYDHLFEDALGETPDTPSTEALTAHDDLMRYFGEVSMGGPLHHGTEQWDRLSREVRRIVASLARQEAADTSGLREALEVLYRNGYQPMYNGRPSCPFCSAFVDDEETHTPDCILRAALRGATE